MNITGRSIRLTEIDKIRKDSESQVGGGGGVRRTVY